MKDFQRNKVYNAEHEWDDTLSFQNKKFKTLEEAELYLKHLLSKIPILKKQIKSITLKRGGWSYATEDGIQLAKDGMLKATLLHEFAHFCVPDELFPAHGAMFCHVFSYLVLDEMGSVAYSRLVDCYQKHKVKYRLYDVIREFYLVLEESDDTVSVKELKKFLSKIDTSMEV